MTIYPLKCPKCRTLMEVHDSADNITDNIENGSYCCPSCGFPMKQDFGSKNPVSTFHPTKDLYAQSLKQRARKKHARGTYYDSY